MLCDLVSTRINVVAGCICRHQKDLIQTDEFVQVFRPKTCIKPSADQDVRYNNKFFFIREKKFKTSAYPYEASTIFQTALAAGNKL